MYEWAGFDNEIMVGEMPIFVRRAGDIRIVCDGQYISFRWPGEGDEYAIELCRANTPAKIFGWLVHLSRKEWVSKDLLCEFIAVALASAVLPIEFD